MIFSREQYESMRLVAMVAIRAGNTIDVEKAIELGFDYDALISLYSQLAVKHLKLSVKKFYRGDKIMREIHARFTKKPKGESLEEMSKEYGVGTIKFATQYMQYLKGKDFPFNSIIANPEIIEDEILRKEIISMIANDPICAYDLEMVKDCLGREYEVLLSSMLSDRKMCFATEDELRKRGLPKTPDFLFLVPMAIHFNEHDYRRKSLTDDDNIVNQVRSPSPIKLRSDSLSVRGVSQGGLDRVVVNWIDSKAMFADMDTFREHREQFRMYNNRYGRGLVIYWHGCVDDVYAELRGEYVAPYDDSKPSISSSSSRDPNSSSSRVNTVSSSPETLLDAIQGEGDDMVLVRDCFPDRWFFPTGEEADGAQPVFDRGTT